MDGSIKPGMRGTEEIVTTAMANLAERTEELRRAMSEFGVRPGHPESVLLHAMTSSQLAFGDMAAEMALAVANTQEGAKALVEAEIRELREAIRVAEAVTAQAKAAAAATEVQRDQVIESMIAKVAPGLVDKLGGTLVIKARQYERRRRLLFYLQGAGMFGSVLLVGFLLSYWQTYAAVSGVERCRAGVVLAPDGRGWCLAENVLGAAQPVAAQQAQGQVQQRR